MISFFCMFDIYSGLQLRLLILHSGLQRPQAEGSKKKSRDSYLILFGSLGRNGEKHMTRSCVFFGSVDFSRAFLSTYSTLFRIEDFLLALGQHHSKPKCCA